jgi:WD40 repeat protein
LAASVGGLPTAAVGSERGIAISADGRVAVSASNDQTLKVWDVVNSYYRNVMVARNRASGLARLFPRVP